MTVDTKAIRADVRRCIYGGAGAREQAWASTAEAMADEVDRLRAAITQALGQLNFANLEPDVRNATVTLRQAIGIEVGP